MSAITLTITIDANACPGGGHFGADIEFAGRQYRVDPLRREMPNEEEIREMLETLVACLTADKPSHADVRKAMSPDPVTLRPEAEAVR